MDNLRTISPNNDVRYLGLIIGFFAFGSAVCCWMIEHSDTFLGHVREIQSIGIQYSRGYGCILISVIWPSFLVYLFSSSRLGKLFILGFAVVRGFMLSSVVLFLLFVTEWNQSAALHYLIPGIFSTVAFFLIAEEQATCDHRMPRFLISSFLLLFAAVTRQLMISFLS